MAVTSPDNLWSPDSSDGYDLTVDLAAMQGTVQTALNTVKVPDTGWQPLAYQPDWGVGAVTPAMRRIGKVVYLTGVVQYIPTGMIPAGDTNTFCILPVGFRPGRITSFVSTNADRSSISTVRISDVDGSMRVRTVTNASKDVYIDFSFVAQE